MHCYLGTREVMILCVRNVKIDTGYTAKIMVELILSYLVPHVRVYTLLVI